VARAPRATGEDRAVSRVALATTTFGEATGRLCVRRKGAALAAIVLSIAAVLATGRASALAMLSRQELAASRTVDVIIETPPSNCNYLFPSNANSSR
jgi:hypothetical protein